MKRHERSISTKILYFIKEHIENNSREYIIISIIFLIGIVLGVIFINNINNIQQEQINNYINSFVEALKTDYEIDTNSLLHKTIISNIILVIGIWLISMIAVIGIPIVCTVILFRGFLLGYTISSSVSTFGIWKGILFNISSLFFQNIIFIPCLIALGVSGIKLYKSIVNNKKRESVKIEIIKHTIFSAIVGSVLILSSFIEAYVSGNLLNIIVNYV